MGVASCDQLTGTSLGGSFYGPHTTPKLCREPFHPLDSCDPPEFCWRVPVTCRTRNPHPPTRNPKLGKCTQTHPPTPASADATQPCARAAPPRNDASDHPRLQPRWAYTPHPHPPDPRSHPLPRRGTEEACPPDVRHVARVAGLTGTPMPSVDDGVGYRVQTASANTHTLTATLPPTVTTGGTCGSYLGSKPVPLRYQYLFTYCVGETGGVAGNDQLGACLQPCMSWANVLIPPSTPPTSAGVCLLTNSDGAVGACTSTDTTRVLHVSPLTTAASYTIDMRSSYTAGCYS